MQIMLAADVEAFVEEQVRAGASPNAAALVNEALRAWSVQQPKPFVPDEELEAWLLEAADAPASPLTAGDFSGIRVRTRNRRDGV